MKGLLLFLISFFTCDLANARSVGHFTEKDYAEKPVWMQMMNDTSTNFFEVEKAYTVYWQHHAMPKNEEEMGMKGVDKDKRDKEEHEGNNETNTLGMEVKRYREWKITTRPFVRRDGSILTASERLKLWKKQREEADRKK